MYIIQIFLLSFLFTVSLNIQTDKKFKEPIVDLSEDCENNYTTSIQLHYGTGFADARIILLRSIGSLARKCSVLIIGPYFEISCGKQCMIVFVVELSNFQKSNSYCKAMEGGIFLKSDESQFVDICADVKNQSIKTYLIFKEKIVVDINFAKFSGSIKITVTAAKYLNNNYDNCTTNEVYCTLNEQVFCVNELLKCDGNLNCGTPKLYDENCGDSYVQENFLFTIIYGTCLIAVVIFFFVQILRTCVPTVGDHFFVFNENEEYNFVLTSQSLPPFGIEDEREIRREQIIARPTDTQIY